MKSLTKTIAIIALLSAPIAAFAQSDAPLTRAQVRAELVQLEQAGYNPVVSDPMYPSMLQAAEHNVSTQNGLNSVGGVQSGSSNQSASRAVPHAISERATDFNSPYFGN